MLDRSEKPRCSRVVKKKANQAYQRLSQHRSRRASVFLPIDIYQINDSPIFSPASLQGTKLT